MTKKVARKPERYSAVKPLLAAVESWCRAEVGEPARAWLRPIVADLPHIVWRPNLAEGEAQVALGRVLAALHEADAWIRKHRERPTSFHAAELRRIVAAVKPLQSAHVAKWPEAERTQLVEHVTMIRPSAVPREIAIVSLLAGNGRGWATERIKLARESAVSSHWPTVLDVVRAEDRAVGQTLARSK